MIKSWEAEFCSRYSRGRGDPLLTLAPKQIGFEFDKNTLRKWLGSRRSGKTHGIVVHFLRNALPGQEHAYITKSIGFGRGIIWKQFQQLNHEYGLNLKFREGRHCIELPNGATVQLYGLTTMPESNNLRGKKFPIAVIDEAGHINEAILINTVKESLPAATFDFLGRGGRGTVLAGTPSKLVDSYWHELCKDQIPGKNGFHFTRLEDNPFFKGREELVYDAYCKDYKVKRTDAAFIREMLGQFCIDKGALCYNWDGTVLPDPSVPSTGMTVMGVDFGFTHACAWVVIRCIPPFAYVCETYEESGLGTDQIAAKTQELRKKWNVAHIIGDAEDPRAIHDLNTKHGVPITAAKKAGSKLSRIWFMDSCLRSKTLFLGQKTTTLQEQLRSVGWNDKRSDHHKSQADHSLDAGHYALEFAVQIGIQEPIRSPDQGSPEYFDQETQKLRDLLASKVAQRQIGGRRR